MWIGWIEFDVLLGDVRSLKEKRALIRPLVSELRHRFQVSAAEVDHLDLLRRGGVGVAAASADAAHLVALLDSIERFVAGRPEARLLSARRGVGKSDE